jgi:cell division septal protein FtsQ
VHRALELFPLIERYAIERIPPQTLVLRIEERDAAVAIERDGAFALYDPAGVLLGSAAELPAGTPLAAGAVLDTTSPAFTAATRVIRDMPDDVRAGIVGVQATTAEDIVLTLAGGTQVVWGGPEQTQRKAVVLRSMIASLGTPAMIDVSAPDNPVFK